MKIRLVDLGLSCEKKESCECDLEGSGCECGRLGYNTRTAENEKSVLFIDEEKLAQFIFNTKAITSDPRKLELSFMSIQKE